MSTGERELLFPEKTLKGLLAHWLVKRKHKPSFHPSVNGDITSVKDISTTTMSHSRIEIDGGAENDHMVYPPFEFSTICPPSVIIEGLHGCPWRKKITDLDGIADDEDFPLWVLEYVLNNRLPPREHTNFYLHPAEGSSVQILTQGKLSAPINKVVNYSVEKRVPDKPLEGVPADGTFGPSLAGGPLQHPVAFGDASFLLDSSLGSD